MGPIIGIMAISGQSGDIMNITTAHGVFVRTSHIDNHTLHCIDLNTNEIISLGEAGWFPSYYPAMQIITYLKTPHGGPDTLCIAEIENDRLRLLRTIGPDSTWSGPPFLFDGHGNIIVRTTRDESSVTSLDSDGNIIEMGRVVLPSGTRISSMQMIDRQPAMLLVNDISHRISICDSELSVQWETPSLGGMIFDDRLALISPDGMMLTVRPVSQPDVIDLSFDISEYTRSRNIDWWRPLCKLGDYIAVGMGLDTVLVNMISGWQSLIVDAIHMTSIQSSSDVDLYDIEKKAAVPNDECPDEVGDTESKSVRVRSDHDVRPSATSNKVMRYGIRGWSEGFPVLLFSGCPWSATGGAQRPVALARKLAARGRSVFYYSASDAVSGFVDGVTIVSKTDFPAFLDYIRDRKGVVICAFPSFRDDYQKLIGEGWVGIYDMLDDWGGFLRHGEVDQNIPVQEWDVIAASSMVTCSVEQLADRARLLGVAPELIRVIPNGGPDHPFGPYIPPDDMLLSSPIVAIYSGYTSGSWFDWDCLQQLDGDDRICTNVVGGLSTKAFSNIRFLGERSYPVAKEYIGASHVGIIPFRDEEICHAVDPIKAYDYWAAGLWVVSSSVIKPMENRPYSITVKPTHFAEAIMEAAERRLDDPVPDEYVVSNSWSSRGRDFDDVISMVKPSISTVRLVKAEPKKLEEEDCNLRMTIQFPAGCNMEPPCPYCANRTDREQKLTPIIGSINMWLDALRWLEADHGPLHITSCYGEPLSDISCVRLFAEMGGTNLFDLVTNLEAPMDVIEMLPKNGNIRLATSFHPHHWSIDEFIAKRQAVERLGIHCGVTLIVAYPPYLKHLDEWKTKVIEELGGTVEILPFYGGFHGKNYPYDYSDAERALVLGEQNDFYDRKDESIVRYTSGVPCWAGRKYIYVHWNGDVHRCPSPFVPKIGNLFERNFSLSSGPTPCESDYCGCSDLWKYMVEDAVPDGITDKPRRTGV